MNANVTGKGAAKSFVKKKPLMSQKSIAIFGYKQSLLSIEMKTKVVQHVSRFKLENFENTKNDPWDMLNNFCFHVYAQK